MPSFIPFSAFPHVIQYEKEKQDLLAARAAAVEAHDRLGDFNVPLVNASETEISRWIDAFLAAHTEECTKTKARKLKAPTPVLLTAIPKITQRGFVWKQQHRSLEQTIHRFQVSLTSALDLAGV